MKHFGQPGFQTADKVGEMLPFEVIVVGTPVSHQAQNRQALRSWQAEIQAAARASLPAGAQPVLDSVEIHVVYYHDEDAAHLPDEDNMLKPIQDALQGLVYEDDGQITDGTCRKRNFDSSFKVRGLSAVLAEGFVQGREFVHITVALAPDPTVLTP
jgi:crossover junction endodeoxyribonuclease RusA